MVDDGLDFNVCFAVCAYGCAQAGCRGYGCAHHPGEAAMLCLMMGWILMTLCDLQWVHMDVHRHAAGVADVPSSR